MESAVGKDANAKQVKKYNEDHAYALRSRIKKLIEEAKDKCADNGIKLTSEFYDELTTCDLMVLLRLEALYIALDDDIDKIRDDIENEGIFIIEYFVQQEDDSYGKMGAWYEARLMTEEETMQHKCLKKFNII